MLFYYPDNKWSENDNKFGKIMKGRKNVIILIENERQIFVWMT